MKSKPHGYSVELFLARKRKEVAMPVSKLPDAIEIRIVDDIHAIPQARTDFTLGAGSRTTVATIPIDYRRARNGR